MLVLGTVAAYSPLFFYGFINYDDPDYLLGNEHVKNGLTWAGIQWAFTTSAAANWHPVTWISHMLDCQLFGLNPAGHHLGNILLHAANAVLLFILLNRLTTLRPDAAAPQTSTVWRSAMVAALFAWHPIHVESVAWASERKDVLSAFFALLALLCYANFVSSKFKVQSSKSEAGLPAFNAQPSTLNYLLALFFFACGLMSKPMVVTLPFVMLLLDYWPLQRLKALPSVPGFHVAGNQKAERPQWAGLIMEKIPFFVLTLVSCLITLRVQREAMWSPTALPFYLRLENGLVSYIRYLSKVFWPTDLALVYPYQLHWSIVTVLLALAVIGIWTMVFVQRIKESPYLLVGWLWFFGTLVPVIGLVQVGATAMADRYAYLPSIGIFIMVVWGAGRLLEKLPEPRRVGGAVGALALAGCLALTSVQLRYWHSSIELFWHAIKVTDNNYAAYDCFGKALEDIGEKQEAEKFYANAVHVNPQYPMAQFDLAMIQLERGDKTNAPIHLAAAVHLSPRNAVMQYDYAVFLADQGRSDEAITHFKAALAARPGFAEAQARLDALQTNTAPARE